MHRVPIRQVLPADEVELAFPLPHGQESRCHERCGEQQHKGQPETAAPIPRLLVRRHADRELPALDIGERFDTPGLFGPKRARDGLASAIPNGDRERQTLGNGNQRRFDEQGGSLVRQDDAPPPFEALVWHPREEKGALGSPLPRPDRSSILCRLRLLDGIRCLGDMVQGCIRFDVRCPDVLQQAAQLAVIEPALVVTEPPRARSKIPESFVEEVRERGLGLRGPRLGGHRSDQRQWKVRGRECPRTAPRRIGKLWNGERISLSLGDPQPRVSGPLAELGRFDRNPPIPCGRVVKAPFRLGGRSLLDEHENAARHLE
jgi:hypothetical protein